MFRINWRTISITIPLKLQSPEFFAVIVIRRMSTKCTNDQIRATFLVEISIFQTDSLLGQILFFGSDLIQQNHFSNKSTRNTHQRTGKPIENIMLQTTTQSIELYN